MKIKIENLKKEPFTSKKDGKNYVRVSILSAGKVYTCLEGKWNQEWAIGQEIDVDAVEDNYNGKITWKIKAPAQMQNNPKLDEILENTRIIIKMLTQAPTPDDF